MTSERFPDSLNQKGLEAVEKGPPWERLSRKSVKPLDGAYEEPACWVSRRREAHRHCSGLCGELRVVVSSKESWDPSKLKGEKTLLSWQRF